MLPCLLPISREMGSTPTLTHQTQTHWSSTELFVTNWTRALVSTTKAKRGPTQMRNSINAEWKTPRSTSPTAVPATLPTSRSPQHHRRPRSSKDQVRQVHDRVKWQGHSAHARWHLRLSPGAPWAGVYWSAGPEGMH
jgi:hypothetical protein